MKKSLLIVLLSMLSLAVFAQMPDITFDQPWSVPAEASIDGDVLTITGDPGKYIIATLTTSIPSADTLYFIADVRMSEMVTGPAVWDRPKLKVYDSAGAKLKAQNLGTDIQETWLTVGVEISVNNTDAIILELGVQNCSGTVQIRNPYLTDTLPEPVYEYPFNLPADTSSSIDIDTTGGVPFVNDIISVNSLFSRSDFGYEDERIKELIRYINLPHLRFPGGTVANFYDWETDTFYNDEWAFESRARQNFYDSGRRFEFDEYAALMLETGATSTLMFNTIYDSVEKSQARLLDRIASGITIDWVEMGNENFYGGQNYGRISGIDNYISFTKSLAAGLKEIDPAVKVAVNINDATYEPDTWAGLLAEENYYDAAIVHSYFSPSTPVYDNLAIYQTLNCYKRMTGVIEEYKAHFSVPLIMSEWAVNTEANYIRTLATADTFFALIDESLNGPVSQAGIHILFDGEGLGTMQMFGWDDSKITASSLGIMYAKYSHTFRDSTVISGPASSAELAPGLPAVNARAVISPDGKTRIVAVNKLSVDSPMTITVNNAAYTGSYSLETYTADPLSNPVYAYNADPWTKSSGAGNPVLPPLSISVITLNSTSAIQPGDVNSDGSVDIVDALMIARYSAGLNPAGFNEAAADVDCSGTLDIIDAMVLARYSAGLIPALPCGWSL